MGYKSVTGKRKYFKLAEIKPGTVLFEDGIFEKIEAAPEGSKFNTQNYLFRLPDDETVAVLNGSGTVKKVFGLLDENTGKIIPGDVGLGRKVRVTYAGKRKLETGKYAGMDCHDYKIEVADDDGVRITHNGEAPKVEVPVEEATLAI